MSGCFPNYTSFQRSRGSQRTSSTVESQKLALQYIVKLKSNVGIPAYSSVFQPNYRGLFDAKPNIVPTVGLRLGQALSECGVNIRLIPSTPPWLFRFPGFDYTRYNVGIKSNTSPDLYLSPYIKLVSADYEGYNSIFGRSFFA
jgi:hypothetical protein